MSKYLEAAIKSLRKPICEGKGIQVFRLDEGGTNLYPEGKFRRIVGEDSGHSIRGKVPYNKSLNEAANTTLSKVKGNIPVRVKGVDLELKLTRNRNVKKSFNVSITGASKAVRVLGAVSGNTTVGDAIARINRGDDRPKVTLREGAWQLPRDKDEFNRLAQLINKKVTNSEFQDIVYHIIGDDDLFDKLDKLDPDGIGDAAKTTIQWMKDQRKDKHSNFPEIWMAYEYSQKR